MLYIYIIMNVVDTDIRINELYVTTSVAIDL